MTSTSNSKADFRSIKREDAMEDTYFLRRRNSYYVYVFNEGTNQEDIKALFSSDFNEKVLNAVALTKQKASNDSFLLWTKSPCDSLPPKLTNIWKTSTGFRWVL